MIIHEDNDPPVEVSTLKASQMETKYVIVKNHVRELTVDDGRSSSANFTPENPSETEKNDKKKGKKSSKKVKNKAQSWTNSDNETNVKAKEISQSDLEELRTVYKQCKDVINRMEMKYGHLLNFEDEAGRSLQQGNRNEDSAEECNCSANKKIIFDEDGQTSLKESTLEKHVCLKKLKRRHSDTYSDNRNVQKEYEEPVTLPDDLKSLTNILRDTNLELSLRHKVINKMRMIRQEYMSEIRFNKASLVKKMKTDADELLDFKGTNLASLPGYPN